MKAATLDRRLDDRLADAERRFTGIQEALVSPEVLSSPDKLRELGQERAYLEPIVTTGQALRDALGEHADAVELIEESGDPEMKAMAEEEAESVRAESAAAQSELRKATARATSLAEARIAADEKARKLREAADRLAAPKSD